VATYLIQNCIWWIEYAGLSGVRIDTYGYSDHAFLSAWSKRLTEEYPQLNFVGEEWSTNPVVVSYWLRGKQHKNGFVSYLPSVMDFPLNDTLRRSLLNPDTMHTGWTELYEALVNDELYPQPNNLVLFEGNHDVSRLYSALDEDLALYKLALTYVLTMHRIPQLYYGTEILMTSTKHRDDGAFRRDFPGGWSGDKINAFTGVGLSDRQKDAQTFVKKLLNWRKNSPAIHHGELRHYTPENGVYVYFRQLNDQRVMVVLNKNQQATQLDLRRFEAHLKNRNTGKDIISGRDVVLKDELNLEPRMPMVIELNEG
jgi:glycosidase